MFTLETERRVPGPETGGAAKHSSQDPVPGILRGKVAALPPLDDPLTEKGKENLILPISFSLYNLHFHTLPPRKHKYPEQPTTPISK